MGKTEIKIGIADDHEVFVGALKALLDQQENFRVTITANDGKTILDKMQRHSIDVLLLDIEMPNLDGFEVMKQISVKYPEVKAIGLSMHNSDSIITGLFKHKARGFVAKGTAPSELILAINTVVEQGYYFNEAVSKALARKIADPSDTCSHLNQVHLLTAKDKEVIALVCKGLSTAQMADHFSVSPRTIQTYRHRIYSKIGENTISGLVMFAVRNQLVEIY